MRLIKENLMTGGKIGAGRGGDSADRAPSPVSYGDSRHLISGQS